MFPQPGSGGECHEDLAACLHTRSRAAGRQHGADQICAVQLLAYRPFRNMSSENIADSPGPSGKEVSD